MIYNDQISSFNQSFLVFNQIFETAGDGMRLINTDYTILNMNTAFCQMAGIHKNDGIGKKCYDIFHGNMCHTNLCSLNQIMNGNNRIECDVIKKSKDGSDIPCIMTVTPLRDDKGDIIGIVENFKNIIERQKAEETIRKQKALLNTILSITPELIALKDKQKIYRLVNKPFCEMVGLQEDDILGKTNQTLLSKPYADMFDDYDHIVFTSGKQVVKDFSIDIANQMRWYNIYLIPWLNEAGQMDGILYSIRDITDYKQLELALINSKNMLEDRVKERTQEISLMNEELKEEIHARTSFEKALKQSEKNLKDLSSQLLLRQEKERKRISNELHDVVGHSLTAINMSLERLMDECSKYPKKIKTQFSFISSLVKKLMQEVRHISVNLRPSLLDDIGLIPTISWYSREFEKIFQHIFIEYDIQIKEKDIPVHLKIEIFRVMQEAMFNAGKHANSDTIYIFLEQTDQRIMIRIKDKGQGFHIKDKLSRLGPEKRFGILSMKERTELSGGIFKIESEIDMGTQVIASWPKE